MHSHIENPYGDDNGNVVYSYQASNSEMDDTLPLRDWQRICFIWLKSKILSIDGQWNWKTRHRVNGLEYTTIPQLEETIRYIELKIEETERANLIRIMKVK